MRGGIVHGRMWPFGAALGAWVMLAGFKSLTVLAATVSPVLRERDTNR